MKKEKEGTIIMQRANVEPMKNVDSKNQYKTQRKTYNKTNKNYLFNSYFNSASKWMVWGGVGGFHSSPR